MKNLKEMYKEVCKELKYYEELDGYHCLLSESQYKDWENKEDLARQLENALGLPKREPRTIFYI